MAKKRRGGSSKQQQGQQQQPKDVDPLLGDAGHASDSDDGGGEDVVAHHAGSQQQQQQQAFDDGSWLATAHASQSHQAQQHQTVAPAATGVLVDFGSDAASVPSSSSMAMHSQVTPTKPASTVQPAKALPRHLLGAADEDMARQVKQAAMLYNVGQSFDEVAQQNVAKKAALQVNTSASGQLPRIGTERATLLGKEAPVDRLNVAFLIFFLLGVGCLFPWNAFITAESYFGDRFNGTAYESSYSNYFTFTFQGTNILCLALSLRLQHLFPVKLRIVGPFVVQFISFLLTTIMVKMDSVSVEGFFGFTLVTVILCGGTTAFLQGGLFGLAGMLPARYTGALMSGQALGGIIVSLASIFSTVGSSNQQVSAIAYFTVSVVVILGCLIGFFVLLRLPVYKFYMEVADHHKAVQSQSRINLLRDKQQRYGSGEGSSPLLSPSRLSDNMLSSPLDSSVIVNGPMGGSSPAPPSPTPSTYSTTSPTKMRLSMFRRRNGSNHDSERGSQITVARSFDFGDVWKRIWPLALAVGYNFFVTLSVFPSITSSINSYTAASDPDNYFFNNLFTAVSCFLFFNLGDYFGRILASWFAFPSAKYVWIPILLRTIFIPFFMLCNISGTRLDVVFTSDAWPFILMALFATTNGYFGSLCMMYAPNKVEVHEKEIAGTMMVFCLSLGLSLGSLISFGFKAIVTGVNPF
ncbi:hypothetical protein CAOG_02889 [Capsaspora owczarzaki ATCC 30864]|uniref:hypothetical protein n=1 Tax=Capsaspora owczarzaki (strain ATCC 30864) TaxID=595528 RepID=UPI0001FE29FF|nr:hypothetical protein CAOG_02889 [Capsaspora owczarzaki ATCC 30864]|eukprot:XP_004363728.1 hypothetical protein CAOG_02889 [Capsaspora owczarzaki ATCC 30864]